MNQSRKITSQSTRLVIDMILYKALWQSNQFNPRQGKRWGSGRAADDSSRSSKTSGLCPARAGCANDSHFENDTLTIFLEVTLCSPLKNFDSGKNFAPVTKQAVCFILVSYFPCSSTMKTKEIQYFPLKRIFCSNGLHSIIFRKQHSSKMHFYDLKRCYVSYENEQYQYSKCN
jgi:hypothetical protein